MLWSNPIRGGEFADPSTRELRLRELHLEALRLRELHLDALLAISVQDRAKEWYAMSKKMRQLLFKKAHERQKVSWRHPKRSLVFCGGSGIIGSLISYGGS